MYMHCICIVSTNFPLSSLFVRNSSGTVDEMKFSCALAVILMTSSVSAFSLGPSISPGLTKLFAFRQTYQYQLDEGTGKVNINGASFDTETASAQIDADLKESKVAEAEAMARFAALEAAVRAKEQQQREMALKMRDELQ
jgi:hypothetical protein